MNLQPTKTNQSRSCWENSFDLITHFFRFHSMSPSSHAFRQEMYEIITSILFIWRPTRATHARRGLHFFSQAFLDRVNILPPPPSRLIRERGSSEDFMFVNGSFRFPFDQTARFGFPHLDVRYDKGGSLRQVLFMCTT